MNRLAMAIVAAVVLSGPSMAGEDADLVINGETLTTRVAAPADSPLPEIISGWVYRNDETQSLQMDDFDNPGMIFVDQARDQWTKVDGAEGKSCASCHGDVEDSMKGVRASMPKMRGDKLWALENEINNCRTERMGADKWKWEGDEMVAMTALIGLQSRGMPVNVVTDGPASPWYDKGKELYYTRVGQLDMACANCHEDNYGNMIRADRLSQGQINGFPVYRLKWQGLGSIHRRFKGCMENIRATPYDRGSDEFLALELYLASRGNGLSVETPAVRN